MHANDKALSARVEEVFRGSSRVDHREIQVEAHDEMIHLTGAVDSAAEKRISRELAQGVPGVKGVIDQLDIKNWSPMPDGQLAEEVRHRLQRDAYTEDAEIEVYASGGQVRLDGTVPTYHAKKAAEDVAWWTPGVRDVESLLLVSEEEFVDVSPGEVVEA
jgi:osmotically-inducible protein OsmY